MDNLLNNVPKYRVHRCAPATGRVLDREGKIISARDDETARQLCEEAAWTFNEFDEAVAFCESRLREEPDSEYWVHLAGDPKAIWGFSGQHSWDDLRPHSL